MNKMIDRCHPGSRWHLLACLVLVTSVMASETPTPIPGAKPLTGGWTLRTGVNPTNEADASIDAEGAITVAGGGERGNYPRGKVHPAARPRFTAAFVYKAFTGDFILTARRVAFDKGTGHGNSGSGFAAIGDLGGLDTPMASSAADFGDKPVWLRIIRKGDRLGLYEGPDGQRWMASNHGAQIAGTVYAGVYTESWGADGSSKATFDHVTIDEKPKFTYSTTWLGNDFEGGSTNTVNSNMFGLGVAPDGTCITTGCNGEQENDMGRYQDGRVTTLHPGNNVGASGNAVFLLPNGEGLVAKKNRLQRFDWATHNGTLGTLSGGIGSREAADAIRGLWVAGDEIFVGCRPENAIIVLDLEELGEKRRLPFTRPGPLTVDANGVVWVVEEGWTTGHPYTFPYEKPFRILGLDRESGEQVGEITGVELPSAIFADSHGGSTARLLVADNGRDQQVKAFDVADPAKPKALGCLGAKGGTYAGTPGEMKPGKFHGLSGVGSDAKGTIYVSSNGYPYRVVMPGGMPGISSLRSFAPAALGQPEPEALWWLHCTGACGCIGATWDEQRGEVNIAGLARYTYDRTRGLGKEYQLAGLTLGARDEPDAQTLLNSFLAAPRMLTLGGQRFLAIRDRMYQLDANGNLGTLVRITNFEGRRLREMAKHRAAAAGIVEAGHAENADREDPASEPAAEDALELLLEEPPVPVADPRSLDGLFARFPADAPTPIVDKDGNPSDWRFWEWVDGTGGPKDGLQQRGEYRDLTPQITRMSGDGSCSASIDAKGDMWIYGIDKGSIQFRRFAGLKNGVPTWEDAMTEVEIPAIITHLYGLNYDEATDTMDLVGQTVENPGGVYLPSEVIRFRDWSGKREMGTRIRFMERGVNLPWGGEGSWQVPHIMDKVVGFAFVGDVLYATNRTGAIRAYDLNQGNLIEWFDAGPEVFAGAGFFDYTDTAVQAFAIAKDEHLLLRQSNWTIRILEHRWNPTACNSGRLPPAPEIEFQSHADAVELRWGGRTGVTGTVKGFQIYRAEKQEGPFHKLALCTEASFRDPRPDGTPAWYRVATINLVGEGPQSEPRLGGVATACAKRVHGRGTIGADGFDLATRGDWQGVYGADGAYLVQDHAARGETAAPRRDFLDGYVVWPGSRGDAPAWASDDHDRLQSVATPGKRCPNDQAWWSNQFGPVVFQFSITDGRPRQIAIAYAHNATFVLRDIDTGAVLCEEQVAWPHDDFKLGYVAFDISGNVRLEMTGQLFRAVFIDPVPGGK